MDFLGPDGIQNVCSRIHLAKKAFDFFSYFVFVFFYRDLFCNVVFVFFLFGVLFLRRGA